jgi:hypothetical protein
MKDSDTVCARCGERAKPRTDRARLLSVVVDATLQELDDARRDEESKLMAVEVLLAVKQSPVYNAWLKQADKLPVGSAIPQAVVLGWALREAVESNRWGHLPRASDPEYTELLRRMSREL